MHDHADLHDGPLLMVVAKEGSIIGCIDLSGQPQEQRLREAQSQGELIPQLPYAVQQQQEDWRLLLETGVGIGRVSTALLEWVSSLEEQEGIHIKEYMDMDTY